ncbi:MAG: histidine kinase N-terminal 7TM domain-containing protein [Candidatus Latescibacterota bacterium]
MFVYHAFSAHILLITGFIAIFIAFFVFPRRKVPGGIYFFFLMLSVAGWAITNAFEISSAEFATKVFWSKLSYLSITSVAPLWYLFALRYTQRDKWLTKGHIVLFWIIPVVVFLLAVTNDLHGLIWPAITPLSTEPGALLVYAHGPGVWLDMIYSYVLLIISTILIIKITLTSQKLYRRQAFLLTIGAIAPWIGNFIYLTGLFPFKGVDITPFVFTLTGLLIGLGLFRYQLLDLVPVAHDTLIASMKTGVLTIDTKNRLVDFNPAAGNILGISSSDIGREVENTWFSLSSHLPEFQGETHKELTVDIPESNRWLSVNVSLLKNRGCQVGRLIVVQDITERKLQEKEREENIQNLQKALSEIKTLRGFIPICSHCKKIRNDKGFWEQIEKYLGEHSEVEFSHGICPDCMEKHYKWLTD